MKLTIIVFVLLLINTSINSQPMFNASSDLIQTEIDFATYAKENGTRDSFLKFIDDDGILFRPHPVNGKEFLSAQEKRPGFLLWYPSFSVVSKAGDLGFNTGPWEYKKTAEDTSIAFGNFVTVWKKQKDGSWKFLMDLGNSNEKPSQNIPTLNPADYKTAKTETDFKYIQEAKDELFKAEIMFSDLSSSQNLKSAYEKYSSNESIYIRDGNFPLKGNEILWFLESQIENQTWETFGGLVSSSNDLGYTYGKITSWKDAEKKKSSHNLYYMRCWYYDNGNWKILIDVANVIPDSK